MILTRALAFGFLVAAGLVACSAESTREDIDAELTIDPGAVSPQAKPCRPTTCRKAGSTCGATPDGCGGVLNCGVCPAGTTCGGGGVPNQCGASTCTPLTCPVGVNCGSIPDGCGGLRDCGACPPGTTCGGGGTPNVCGS